MFCTSNAVLTCHPSTTIVHCRKTCNWTGPIIGFSVPTQTACIPCQTRPMTTPLHNPTIMPPLIQWTTGFFSQLVHKPILLRARAPLQKAFLSSFSKDPEKRKAQLLKQKEYKKRKFIESEAFRESVRMSRVRYTAKQTADPDRVLANKEAKRLDERKRYSQDDHYRQSSLFRTWVHQNSSASVAALRRELTVCCLLDHQEEGLGAQRSHLEGLYSGPVRGQGQTHLCWMPISHPWRTETLVYVQEFSHDITHLKIKLRRRIAEISSKVWEGCGQHWKSWSSGQPT